MRLAGLRAMLFGAGALLLASTFAGCQNPLDPLNKSDKIEGLTYIDAAATWDRWDSDPEYDGVMIEMSYYNEFGDSLSFHDKPHSIVIEFWTQKNAGSDTSAYLVQDKLFFSKTIEFSNSDDSIRIPIEAYYASIPSELLVDPVTGDPTTEATGFLVVRVFPPQEYPRPDLVFAEPDTVFFKPVVAEGTPND